MEEILGKQIGQLVVENARLAAQITDAAKQFEAMKARIVELEQQLAAALAPPMEVSESSAKAIEATASPVPAPANGAAH
jgi:predicted  nucleic acid-binding Zn-ribbon protein